MKQKLLLKVKLPDTRIMYKDMWVLPSFNIAIEMYYKYLTILHRDLVKKFTPVIKQAYKAKKFPHKEGNQYRISIGYYRGKNSGGSKTKTIDADALFYIYKVATDCIIKNTPIPDDCIFHVPEARCIYKGDREEEEIWLQITVDDYEKYSVLSEYIPNWYKCKDKVTGGISIVHRSQL